MVNTSRQRKLSVAVFGDGMVGKTSLINAFLGNKFTDKYTATTSDVYCGSILHYGERYDIKIVDLPGERDSEIMSTPALRECDVIIVCYSVDDKESFDGIRSFWKPQISLLKHKPRVILAGLQCDKNSSLNDKLDCVTKEEGLDLSQDINCDGFYECCAKSGKKVRDVFSSAVDATIKSKKKKMSFIKRALGR